MQGVIFHALQGVTYHAVHGGIHNAMQGVHFIMVTLFGLFGDLPGDAWLPSWSMEVDQALGQGLQSCRWWETALGKVDETPWLSR